MSPILPLLMLLAAAAAYPYGPPLSSCIDMFPLLHNVSAKTTAPPFSFSLSKSSYAANDVITVSVRQTGNTYYEGLFVQMRRVGCNVNSNEPIGTWSFDSATYPELQTMNCASKTASALAQNAKAHYTNHTLTWTAPAQGQGHLAIRATMVHETDEFWLMVTSDALMDSTSSEKLTCDAAIASASLLLALVFSGAASLLF